MLWLGRIQLDTKTQLTLPNPDFESYVLVCWSPFHRWLGLLDVQPYFQTQFNKTCSEVKRTMQEKKQNKAEKAWEEMWNIGSQTKGRLSLMFENRTIFFLQLSVSFVACLWCRHVMTESGYAVWTLVSGSVRTGSQTWLPEWACKKRKGGDLIDGEDKLESECMDW